MLDCHCHIDMYSDPLAVAGYATARGAFIVAMTNLPSHFAKGLPHVRGLTRLRLALGLHPLAAEHHAEELALFERLFPATSFIGEVGLDFSRKGAHAKNRQLETFHRVIEMVAKSPKVLSLHSRGAERDVLAVLREHHVRGAIFHWYTGSVSVLMEALADGHYFSINPSMTLTKGGRQVIAAVPMARVLTESDGPYAKVNGLPAKPLDVVGVEEYLAAHWNKPVTAVTSTIWANFQELTKNVR